MDKRDQETLEWLVQFSQMSLEELKPGDRAKLLVDGEEYLSPEMDLRAFERYFSPSYTRHMEKKDWKTMFSRMAWAFQPKPSRESQKNWDKIVSLKKAIQRAIRFLAEEDPSRVIVGGGKESFWATEVIIHTNKEPGKPFALSLIPITKSHDEYVQVRLFMLLNKLPRSTIHQCPGCEKYFLNASLRKKRFCSPPCMWRFNARKRREADREGYNAKQREIMRRKYAEERKRKLGPNVKVGRIAKEAV